MFLECSILYVIVLLATVSNALLLAMYNICCLKIEIEACFRSIPLCSVLVFLENILRAVVGMVMEKLKETWRALLNVRVCFSAMSQICCTVD